VLLLLRQRRLVVDCWLLAAGCMLVPFLSAAQAPSVAGWHAEGNHRACHAGGAGSATAAMLC
jgi:hypothetical protein